LESEGTEEREEGGGGGGEVTPFWVDGSVLGRRVIVDVGFSALLRMLSGHATKFKRIGSECV